MDPKATQNLYKISGKDLIDSVLEKRGLELHDLAAEIGYSARTLKGVRYGEVPLSPKLESWLQKILSETPEIVSPRLQETAGISMNPQKHSDDETVELLHSLLEDYRNATGDLKRRYTANQIRELAKGLGTP